MDEAQRRAVSEVLAATDRMNNRSYINRNGETVVFKEDLHEVINATFALRLFQ